MKRLLLVTAILLTLNAPLWAAGRSLTCYLDGGVVSQELVVSKGYAEVSLPGGVMPGSLRVKPGGDTVISRVQTVPAPVDPKTEKTLALLDERRELLGDRLKALQTREEIFTAAAKSQSAKAPRKTKSNPEPVTAIRQGTDLALARLEEVYRLRRVTEKELKALEAKRADLARRANVGGSIARIWLQGKAGAVSVDYAVSDAAWKPVYDLRADGSGSALTLRALLPETGRETVVRVVPAGLGAPGAAAPLPVAGDYAPVAAYTLPGVASLSDSPLAPLSLTLTNSTPSILPAGDVSCFWKGEYRGTAQLPLMVPSDRREIVCGRPSAPPVQPSDAGR